MSEQQETSQDVLKWGDSLDLLSEERKQELAQRLWDWQLEMATDERPGPFYHERLNGLEVFWLATCALAGDLGDGKDISTAVQRIRSAQDDVEIRYALKFPGLFLGGAILDEAQLGGAILSEAHLEHTVLVRVHMEHANLAKAYLKRANLYNAHLEQSDLNRAQLKGVNLDGAYLEGAHIHFTRLNKAVLRNAQLRGADLSSAQLERATLIGAHLEGAILIETHLEGADLRNAFFDAGTFLRDVSIVNSKYGCIHIADVRWGDVNLANLKSELTPPLGDEQAVRKWKFTPLAREPGQPKPTRAKLQEHRHRQQERRLELVRAAVRANRQLAVALQNQGMNEEAARFAYRAQVLQRMVYRLSGWRSRGRWLFSGVLDGLAGYGYRPERSIGIYVVVIAVFMGIYYVLGATIGPHLSFYEALVVSVTAFHGRGFFATTFQPGDPQAGVAALEAVIGLLIEISFIATFTQRIFGSK